MVYYGDSGCSIVIDNTDFNDAYIEKKFIVEPNSTYKFSAMVKCSDFVSESDSNSSGASIGKEEGFECSEYVNDDTWTRVEYDFSTGNENEIVLCLRNGMYGSVCKGTAYFSDISLEKAEGEVTNQWDILAVIFKDVNADVTMEGKSFTYTDHLYEQDVDYIKFQLDNFSRSIPELSDELMGINSIDICIPDQALTQLTGVYGDGLCIEPHVDEIEAILKPYLENKEYDQIMFFAPISQVADGWLGLGGTLYLDGINFCQFAYWTQESYEYEMQQSFPETALVHETLHGVETRSRVINPEKTADLHDNLKYGFEDTGDQWENWYTAYMRAELDGGMGIDPAAYKVLKNKSYILISDDMTVNNDEINPKNN